MDVQPSTGGKAIAGLGGGALGGAVMQILAWVLKAHSNIDMPVEIQMAGASVFSTVVAILAAHFTPVNPPKQLDDDVQ